MSCNCSKNKAKTGSLDKVSVRRVSSSGTRKTTARRIIKRRLR